MNIFWEIKYVINILDVVVAYYFFAEPQLTEKIFVEKKVVGTYLIESFCSVFFRHGHRYHDYHLQYSSD